MRIFLRPITERDTASILKWRNSEMVLQHCMSKKPITEASHKKFFKNNVETGIYKQFIVERVEEDFGFVSYPIATVYLKDIDNENKRCELCVFTSNDSEWIVDSQILAIKQLLEKAFTEYGMHKVYSYVFYKFNDEVELLKNAGFSVETILREEALDDNGTFEDIVRMCVISDK